VNLREIAFKKPLKLLMLLMTSVLIATASATIYYSLTMQPQVTVIAPVLKFSTAPDEPTGSNVQDSWCSLNASSYPNATLTYEKAVYINNTDGGSAHSFRLRHVSITPANGTATVGNWTSIKFLVYNSSGYVFSLNYTVDSTNWILNPSSGETSYYSVPQSTGWWIRLETLSPATAGTGNNCDIKIAVDVEQ